MSTMIPSASDPDLLNIVDVLLSSFSGAAAGAASAAPWKSPSRFVLPAEANGQEKKASTGARRPGRREARRNPCWMLGVRRARRARTARPAGGGAGTGAGPAAPGRL